MFTLFAYITIYISDVIRHRYTSSSGNTATLLSALDVWLTNFQFRPIGNITVSK